MAGSVFNRHEWKRLAAESKYDLAAFARNFPKSKRHLRRVAKRHLRKSLTQWLDSLRTEAARQCLLDGQMPKQFVTELGYKDESQFYHRFRQTMHLTPGEFVALIAASKAAVATPLSARK